MYKNHRNANYHLSFFIRQQYWPLLLPSIAILFLIFCPQISQSIRINNNDYNQQSENSDRTVAKVGPREIQLTTTFSPLPLPISAGGSSTLSTAAFDDLM